MITALLSLIPVAHAVTIPISMSIPGVSTTASSTPGTWIANFYQFALMIGGVLAFGIIVFGGVKYMTSAGNPSGQGDAKEWIQAALLGLLLLIGAYFILDIVNPQLLNLGLPTLTPVNIQNATPTTPTAQTPSGQSCGACSATCDGSCPKNSNGDQEACVNGVCKNPA